MLLMGIPSPPIVDPGLLIFYPGAKGLGLFKCTFPSGSLMSQPQALLQPVFAKTSRIQRAHIH